MKQEDLGRLLQTRGVQLFILVNRSVQRMPVEHMMEKGGLAYLPAWSVLHVNGD